MFRKRAEYVKLNTRDLFKGSGLVDINEDFNLTLNEEGIKLCKKGDRQCI